MNGVDDPGTIARRVAEAALRSPDVVRLSSGGFGTLSTSVPGGRIRGVAVRSDTVEVGVVVHFGRPLPEIATELRRGLAPLAGGRVVHISVEDVVVGAAGTRPHTR
ncbi:Asp23/Gls24 family envelope stress response protein [Nocardiopsis lambiniae]|uniref:Asp23/Gls24 family envelope stress response protein n=1 Tax=Nocardiopsis lambiniae TaxID=3075539 RepID=A0ABU2MEH8_9ACTN|nr:hypothetical protein [Nocardiopsis sp. DSM 44743]MDT0331103.1 hypothetical protein [Nocardiopsis sp. DSM 44743]